MMLVTWGKVASFASVSSIAALTDGELIVSPAGALNTTCSVSPDTFGDAAWRMLAAWVDCVLGRLNELV